MPYTSFQVPRCHTKFVVVNLLTLVHYQCTDLGYLFVADFRYRLTRESLIFPHLGLREWGSAYTWDGLYASIYGN